MNLVQPCDFMLTKNIYFKLVEMEDAPFILSLRTDPEISHYLSRVNDDLNAQLDWIRDYKVREELTLELYYVFCSKDQRKKYGVGRIYDISHNNSSCRVGSWIIYSSAPRFAAVEVMVSVYHWLFTVLGIRTIYLDVRKDNLKVINLHRKFGAQFLREDEVNVDFTLTQADFSPVRRRYARFFLPSVLQTLSIE